MRKTKDVFFNSVARCINDKSTYNEGKHSKRKWFGVVCQGKGGIACDLSNNRIFKIFPDMSTH